jgi:hypothetical protein
MRGNQWHPRVYISVEKRAPYIVQISCSMNAEVRACLEPTIREGAGADPSRSASVPVNNSISSAKSAAVTVSSNEIALQCCVASCV